MTLPMIWWHPMMSADVTPHQTSSGCSGTEQQSGGQVEATEHLKLQLFCVFPFVVAFSACHIAARSHGRSRHARAAHRIQIEAEVNNRWNCYATNRSHRAAISSKRCGMLISHEDRVCSICCLGSEEIESAEHSRTAAVATMRII